MKKIGIIGGCGPLATMKYYEIITKTVNTLIDKKNVYPEIVISSVNPSEIIKLIEEDSE